MPLYRITRRELIELLAAGAAASALPWGCARSPAPTYFTDAERRALGALAGYVLPDGKTKGDAYGTVAYTELLLTAFEYDPPRIHAGGPFSGRTPLVDPNTGTAASARPDNGFASFVPLTRVAEAGWRLRLFGGTGPTGQVIGLRDQVRDGLAKAATHAGAPLETLDTAGLDKLWSNLPSDFTDLVTSLVIEGALAPPEYGGNPNLAGWKLAHYPGDSLPLGYAQWDAKAGVYRERPDAPCSTPDPGPDPDPMDPETQSVLTTFVLALGGRTAQ
jgi:hypothetical protein